MAGFCISNFEVEKIIENSGNDDLQKSSVCVFSSNKINDFISKDGKYPFLISNTDPSNKSGTH